MTAKAAACKQQRGERGRESKERYEAGRQAGSLEGVAGQTSQQGTKGELAL
jgi:hypothetical protein